MPTMQNHNDAPPPAKNFAVLEMDSDDEEENHLYAGEKDPHLADLLWNNWMNSAGLRLANACSSLYS